MLYLLKDYSDLLKTKSVLEGARRKWGYKFKSLK